jgi:hypothetical protein
MSLTSKMMHMTWLALTVGVPVHVRNGSRTSVSGGRGFHQQLQSWVANKVLYTSSSLPS